MAGADEVRFDEVRARESRMLVRPTDDGSFECIEQAHHAFLSGVLAGAWMPTSLEPELVQVIGLHDDPWRPVDAEPMFDADRGLPFDFVDHPIDHKIEFYRAGIDRLERVHPWAAYLVSLHYTTFAGTRDVETLTEPEAERRERLESRLPEAFVAASGTALDWLKYFDVLSLYVGLAGPSAAEGSVPHWLRDPEDWSEAPDGTPLELAWRDDSTVVLEPWPFGTESLGVDLELRRLEGRCESERAFRRAWADAALDRRSLEFVPSRPG